MSRFGNFSSSEIYRLTTLGKRAMTQDELDARPKTGTGSKTTNIECESIFSEGGLTYIEEKRRERKLGRPLKNYVHSTETAWGTLIEPMGFEHMDLNYEFTGDQKRLIHPRIHSWTGIPDAKSLDAVADIKSPFTLNSFCDLVSWFDPQLLKENHPDYYYQLVSNAILTDRQKACLFVFVPYQYQLEDVRMLAAKNSDLDLPVQWIVSAPDKKLPYLIEGREYKNANEFIFEVPQSDKDFLERRVTLADACLNMSESEWKEYKE